MEKNIFEYAAKNKLRFPYRGNISTEDLYDLPVEELDKIYKSLNSQIKQAKEESLLQKKTKDDEILEVKIEIVKSVVSDKLAAVEARQKAKERRDQKQKILAIMADKQDAELKGKSLEELQKMLDEME